MERHSILIVDDDNEIRASLSDALSAPGSVVSLASSGQQALEALAVQRPDVVLSDVRMPGMSGLELLGLIRERHPDLPVVLMTAFDDLATVTTGMRGGAAEFLVKPVDLNQLRAVIRRVFEDSSLRKEARDTDPGPAAPPPDSRIDHVDLIGHHPSMVSIFKTVGQVAGSRASVVIRGESGTGKELIARAIHASSPWASEPFVAVNCTALPTSLLESELFGHRKGAFTGASADRRGRFALAGRGTIFLDEIGDTSPEFQSKLLRVLQEHSFYPVGADRPETTEARVLTATHRDLESMVREGRFREDLYYRLRVVEIRIPPLRERRSDIRDLAVHLVRRSSTQVGRGVPTLTDEALAALERHSWPGNVRELENCLTRAVVMAPGGVIRAEHLAIADRPDQAETRLVPLETVEREHVSAVLSAVGGNRSHAADILGISRPRLRRLIEKHAPETDTEGEDDV